MRIKYCLLLCLCISTFASAQWRKRDLKYTVTSLFENINPQAIDFSDSSNGFVVGMTMILKFDRGTWLPIYNEPYGTHIFGVSTINSRNTYFAGYWGTLMKYDGQSFKKYNVDESYMLQSIYMIDSTNGWAVGTEGAVLKISGDTAMPSRIFPGSDLVGVHFDSKEHGWAIGYYASDVDSNYISFVLEYKNKQWFDHTYFRDKFTSIEITPSGKAFITGSKNLYTLDKEQNKWNEVFPGGSPFPLSSISMMNDNFGVCVGAGKKYMVFKSGTWNIAQGEYSDLVNVKCIDTNTIWSLCNQQQPGYQQQKTNNPYSILQYKNDRWYAHSLEYLDTARVLPYDQTIVNVAGLGRKHMRINGARINLPPTSDWPDSIPIMKDEVYGEDVKIFNENIAFANGRLFLEYLNNDETFFFPTYPDMLPFSFITKMHMLADTSIFLTGFNGLSDNYIAHIENRKLVKEYNTFKTTVLNGIHFADNHNGWVVGDSGLIAKYNYQIDEWEKYVSPTNEVLGSVFTIDSVTAWCTGFNGTLLKYDGKSWTRVDINTNKHLFNIYFTDKNHGWIIGQDGTIFKYNGEQWKLDTTITTNNLYSIYMVDSNYGWIGGDNGSLFQYINTDSTLSGRTSGPGIVSSVIPNPVTNKASLKFDLLKAGNTTIKIFDQNGHPAGNYNLGQLDAGSHTYDITVFNLLSGIYIYQIISSSGDVGKGRFLKP
ncbi:MAG: YCF48-related protein [Agriterribacter sp.]